MFEINRKLISFIINDTRHFIHWYNQLRLGLIELGIGRIGVVIGRIGLRIGLIELEVGLIELVIGLIELVIGLIELGIGLMELGIGLKIINARRTVLARVSGSWYEFSLISKSILELLYKCASKMQRGKEHGEFNGRQLLPERAEYQGILKQRGGEGGWREEGRKGSTKENRGEELEGRS